MHAEQTGIDTHTATFDKVHLIALGASAGGLSPLKAFFRQVPPDCPHSFVVIQHLPRNHKSMMEQILAQLTPLPIHTVEEGQVIRAGYIYLIPSDKYIGVKGGKFTTWERPSHAFGLNLPINLFFQSLAQEKGEEAIGVVLSGTGKDGSSGLKAIKEAGGLALVQEPEEAEFEGMPVGAIQNTEVDGVLKAAEMPSLIFSLLEGERVVIDRISEQEQLVLSNYWNQQERRPALIYTNINYPPSSVAFIVAYP